MAANGAFMHTHEDEVGEETLRAEIAYYRAMIADCCRNPQRSRQCIDTSALQQRLTACEKRLRNLERDH